MYTKVASFDTGIFHYCFIMKGKDTLYVGRNSIISDHLVWRKQEVKNPTEVWQEIGLYAATTSVCSIFYE